MKRVNIISGQSRYDIFNLWQQSLCQSFRRLGIEACVVDIDEEATFEPQPGVFSMGFNLVRLWNDRCRGKPHFSWMVDHPAFHAMFFDSMIAKPTLPVNPAQCMVGNVDARWVEFARAFYGFPAVHFMPHAGIAEPRSPMDWAQRDYDVVFFGSVESAARLRESLLRDSGPLQPICEALLDNFSLDCGQSLDKVFLDLLGRLNLPEEKVHQVFGCFLPRLTACLLHAGQRVRLLRAIRRHKVHVFGVGPWAELDMPENVIAHDPVSYSETLEIMARSRVLLNHSPLMGWGAHERIFDGLLCGCAVLSSPSKFVESEFGTQAGLGFYTGDALDQVDGHIEKMLADADMPMRVMASRQIVRRKHLMFHRACAIRDLALARWPALRDEPVPGQ